MLVKVFGFDPSSEAYKLNRVGVPSSGTEFCSLMSTSSSSKVLVPHPLLSLLHPHLSVSKSLTLSKPPLFSSISIERLPTKTYSSSSPPPPPPTTAHSIEDLPPKLQDIVKLFQSVEDSKAKYQQLLFYARNLTPLQTKFKTKDNKVQGCVSQVWVRAYLDSDNKVHFEADSDSSLTKGLAALLVQGLSAQSVPQVLKVSPNFFTLLGLRQSLTPSRNNGFLNMLKMMQVKALQVYKQADDSHGVVLNDGNEVESLNSSEEKPEIATDQLTIDANTTDVGVGLGSRGERIREILARELSPIDFEVEDISHQHAGHTGVGKNAVETHFNVNIVSKVFEGKSLLKRHRQVYDLLQSELQTGLHALSIVAKTPSEIDGRQN